MGSLDSKCPPERTTRGDWAGRATLFRIHGVNYSVTHDSFGTRTDETPALATSNAATDLEDLLPLSPPVYHVLLGLGADTLHGYAIMQAFDALSGGRDQLLPGTLYATLARMVETGVLEETDPPREGADARRRYYRATSFGRSLAVAESGRMRRLLGIAESQRIAGGAT